MAELSTERRWQVLLAGSAAWLDAATVCSRVVFCTCVRSQALALVAARSGLAAAPPLQVGSLHLQFILGASLGDVQELLKPPAQKNELPLGRTPFQVGLLQTSGGACAASQVRCFRAASCSVPRAPVYPGSVTVPKEAGVGTPPGALWNESCS